MNENKFLILVYILWEKIVFMKIELKKFNKLSIEKGNDKWDVFFGIIYCRCKNV